MTTNSNGEAKREAQEPAKRESLPADLQKKYDTWGSFGVALANKEQELISAAETVCETLSTLPSKPEDIKEAEAVLAAAKSVRVDIEKRRKELTGKLGDLTKRLMEPEKKVADAEHLFGQHLLSIKKKVEDERRAKEAEAEKARQLRATIQQAHAQAVANVKEAISNRAAKALAYALDEAIPVEDIAGHIKKWKEQGATQWRVSVADRFPDVPKELLDEVAPAQDYANYFYAELDAVFADYAVAFENKEKAKELAAAEAEKKRKAAEDERKQAEVAASLEAAAIPAEVEQPSGKALRKQYEIDMPETVDSAIAIMAAFVANADKCLPKLRVTKWFSFTPAQAGIALGKVKCDDNAFQPQGITFKEVVKL